MEDSGFFQPNGNKIIKNQNVHKRNAQEPNQIVFMAMGAERPGNVYAIQMKSDPEITYIQIVK